MTGLGGVEEMSGMAGQIEWIEIGIDARRGR